MIVLDTDVLIEILDRKSKVGGDALERILNSSESVAITAINLHEILYCLQKYAKPVEEALQLPTLDYTKRDATLSASIEVEAQRKGKPIRRADAMIAAITINSSANLYTLNLKHFQPLKPFGLQLFPQDNHTT